MASDLSDEFDAIAERVTYIAVGPSLKWDFIGRHQDTMLCYSLNQCIIIVASKGGMSLFCRREWFGYAEVQRYAAAAKPRSTALCKFGRFGHLFEPENGDVKRPGFLSSISRDR
jgi:hypothetical protein